MLQGNRLETRRPANERARPPSEVMKRKVSFIAVGLLSSGTCDFLLREMSLLRWSGNEKATLDSRVYRRGMALTTFLTPVSAEVMSLLPHHFRHMKNIPGEIGKRKG